jgi:uncharacterized protein
MSMYQTAVPQFNKMLHNLSSILKKAEDYAKAKEIEPKVLLESRLFPNMFHLIKQIQIATDQVRHGCGRLAGIDLLKLDDSESSFEHLQDRIKQTIDYIKAIKPEQLNGTEQKDISFEIREHKFNFKGHEYLVSWIIPNFYFHVMTTYNVLRHNGVEIGKKDYLG